MLATAPVRKPRVRRQPLRRNPQPLSVAFVCYGNACRSQMAEAWVRHYGGGRVVAQSAGVHPLGQVTPETQTVMTEKGVALEGQYSKGLETIDWKRVDVLVNMAPYAADRLLPAFRGRRVTWEVTDPFLESLDVYRQVRDDLEERVRTLLEDVSGAAPFSTKGL